MKYEVLFECVSDVGIIVEAKDQVEAIQIARKQYEKDEIESSIVYERRIRKTLDISPKLKIMYGGKDYLA